MRNRLPVPLPALIAAVIAKIVVAGAGSALAAPGPSPTPSPPRKINVSKLKEQESDVVIPAPRNEPVVPASAAKSIAQQLNDAYVAVFERVAPTVVVIDVTKKPTPEGEGADYFPDFFFHNQPDGSTGTPEQPGARRSNRPQSEGSGFVIQSSGFILTNNHVISGADKINVRLKDRRQLPARLIGFDEKTDIAVIKIEAADLPTAELADSDAVRVGEIACAIGVPYNLDYSFTTGVVSAKGRNNLDLGPTDNYEDFIQTDASINPGNSGGPLVNLDGKVMGMNTLINGLNRGLGFAIPSNMLREVGDQIIAKGHVSRPYIGVRITSLDPESVDNYASYFNWTKKGVVVNSILADTPAFHSDLRVTDVITEVDGTAVDSAREFQNQIRQKKIGGSVALTVYRRSRALRIGVATAELPVETPRQGMNNAAESSPPRADADSLKPDGGPIYGMQLQNAPRDAARNRVGGVIVLTVEKDSPADQAQIHARDIITAVDDEPVKDLTALRDAMKKGDPAKGIACIIERPDAKTFALIRPN